MHSSSASGGGGARNKPDQAIALPTRNYDGTAAAMVLVVSYFFLFLCCTPSRSQFLLGREEQYITPIYFKPCGRVENDYLPEDP